MANFKLTQTGEQIQTDLNNVENLVYEIVCTDPDKLPTLTAQQFEDFFNKSPLVVKLSMPSVNQAYYYTRVGYFWTDDTSSTSYSKHAHYIKSDDGTSVLQFQYLYNQKEGFFERYYFQPGVMNLGQVPLLPYKQCLIGSNASGKQLEIELGDGLSLETSGGTSTPILSATFNESSLYQHLVSFDFDTGSYFGNFVLKDFKCY